MVAAHAVVAAEAGRLRPAGAALRGGGVAARGGPATGGGSEEGRVGEEGRSRGAPGHLKKKKHQGQPADRLPPPTLPMPPPLHPHPSAVSLSLHTELLRTHPSSSDPLDRLHCDLPNAPAH